MNIGHGPSLPPIQIDLLGQCLICREVISNKLVQVLVLSLLKNSSSKSETRLYNTRPRPWRKLRIGTLQHAWSNPDVDIRLHL